VIRADVVLLAVELVLIALLLLSLATSTLSHIEAAKLLFSGKLRTGVLGRRDRGRHRGADRAADCSNCRTAFRTPCVPAMLVLVGGFALRWVLVNAGQASSIVSVATGGG
jgi:protein NrfD